MCHGRLPGLPQAPVPLKDFLENFGYEKLPEAPQPPKPAFNPVDSPQGLATLGIGPYAMIGVRTDETKTSNTDRNMMFLLGKKYGCHTCGNRNANKYIPDHQPPSCIFTGNPIPCNRPLYEDENFQYTIPIKPDIKPSVYGKSQFLYPQCEICSSLQGGTCSRLGLRKNKK